MTNRPSFRQALNRAVAEKRLLVISRGYDALSALLIDRAGFDCMFVGGFPVAGARYGVPDIGLAGFSDIAAAVRDIIAAADVPVLVDIDDGYGDVKNAVRTVQTYERMGASAVFLEDQAWPKRCGHMAGKRVVPAAASWRRRSGRRWRSAQSRDVLICVRTDARAVSASTTRCGAPTLHRGRRRGDLRRGAGERRRAREVAAKSFDVPQFANPLVGGRTPILSIKEFEQLGFNAICFGLEPSCMRPRLKTVLADMRSGTFALRDKGMSFEEFKSVVHYDRWDRIDNLYGM